MDLSRAVYEVNGEFSRKSQNFPHHRVFCAPLTGLPLELVISTQRQELERRGYQVVDNFLR